LSVSFNGVVCLFSFMIILLGCVGFSVGDQLLSAQDSYSQECSAGSQIKLVVSLTNSSGLRMPPSFLFFDPSFHCQQRKSLIKDIQHMILHSGSLVVNVPEVRTCIHVFFVRVKYIPFDVHVCIGIYM